MDPKLFWNGLVAFMSETLEHCASNPLQDQRSSSRHRNLDIVDQLDQTCPHTMELISVWRARLQQENILEGLDSPNSSAESMS